MTEQLLPADALAKNAPRTILPLAGFWFRLGALLIDIFILRMALQLTYSALRPFYLSLGPGSTVFGLLVAFAYLVLAEGPVGKGMTLGKAILGIRTTDARGDEPTTTAAAIRAALLLVIALPFLAGQIEAPLLVGGNRSGVVAARALFSSLPSAFIIANVFLVVLHPLKQTVPDLLAKTLVVRQAGEHNLSAFLEQAAEQIEPLERRAFRVATIAFLAFGALNLIMSSKDIFSPDGERALRFLRSFNQEFRYGTFTPLFQPALFGSVERRLAQDGLTSESWATHLATSVNSARHAADWTSQSHTLVIEFRSRRPIAPDAAGTPEQMAALRSRALSWTERQIKEDIYPLDRETRTRKRSRDDRAGGQNDLLMFQPLYLALLFVEDINLLLFRRDKVVHAEILPLTLPAGFYENEERAARSGEAALAPDQDEPISPSAALPATRDP